MASRMWLLALLLITASVSYAADSDVNLLLDHGIALFQKQDYVAAQKDFQRIIQTYPQNKEAITRASFYNSECERLRAKNRATVRVLKFPPEPNRGQILSPGEKPPVSTLQESEKALTPGSTDAVLPTH